MISEAGMNVRRFFHGESLYDIFKGQGRQEDHKTIEDIYKYNYYMLEMDHSFIQWIFPTFRRSGFNMNAPVLTMEDIKILRQDPIIIKWLNLFKCKMFKYWGIQPKDYTNAKLLDGHDGLRLSRLIECLTLFGIEVADIFPVIQELISENIIYPDSQEYEGKFLLIWVIRYKEASKKLIFFS